MLFTFNFVIPIIYDLENAIITHIHKSAIYFIIMFVIFTLYLLSISQDVLEDYTQPNANGYFDSESEHDEIIRGITHPLKKKKGARKGQWPDAFIDDLVDIIVED